MSALLRKTFYRFKSFAADSLWQLVYDGVTLITVVVSFGILQYKLGESGDGVTRYKSYGLVYSILGPVGGLVYAGIGLALFQRLHQWKDDVTAASRRFFSLYAVFAIGGSVLAVYAARVITKGAISLPVIIAFVASELVGRACVKLIARIVQVERGYSAAIKVRLGLEIIKLAVFTVLALADTFTLPLLSLCLVVSYGAYAFFCAMKFLVLSGISFRLEKPRTRTLKESAYFSLPMVTNMVQAETDKSVLGYYSAVDDPEPGLYIAAYRLVTLGLTPVRALDAAAFPRFLRQGSGQNFYLKRSLAFAALLASVGLSIAIAVYFMRPVFSFLFDEQYQGALDMAPWVLPMIPLISLSGTPMNGLLGLDKAFQRSVVYASGAAVSLVLYFLIIPEHGWRGAAVASILSEMYLVVASWSAMFYYQRKQNELELEGDPA